MTAGSSVLSLYPRFARLACEIGDKSAIEYGRERFSYADLAASAQAIAGQLPATGVPVPRTALLFEHRIRAVRAMWGALGAGHAFVLLDAADPEERIRFILNDCEPAALLTDAEHAERARRLAPPGCVVIDIETAPSTREPPAPVSDDPDRLAYLCYTSGSTGQPKGVCQTQRNLMHFVRSYCRTLGIRAEDRLSLLYSLSFSAANMDIFGGLLTGATVCAYDMRRHGIPGLAGWLDESRISVLHAVPTVFRKLVDSAPEDKVFAQVRAIDLGGETVTRADVERFHRHFRRDALLVNHLAATEASVIAQHIVSAQVSYDADSLPVGRCPEGVDVRIERDDGREAGDDEVGRIVIRSPYLSPGYWRRPELNAAAFSDDATQPGGRVFRTEDLGRIDKGGILHFLGRSGTRVKVRGQSVDLTEVETALRQCRNVSDAAVVAADNEDEPEAGRLLAHVVMASRAEGDAVELRRELGAQLPHYMIPTAFAFTDALPTTSSGKVDRRALANQPDANAERAKTPPADALERKIAGIFSRLLKRDEIGRTDDFFLLGGDSISAVELQILLTRLIGRDVLLKDIFQNPTVSGLAETLRSLAAMPQTNQPQSVLVPVREAGEGPALFLVHGRLGQAHISTHFLAILGKDQPLYAFRARGLDGLSPPNQTIDDAVRDYLTALRAVQPRGPYMLGGLCSGSYITMAMAQRLTAEGETVLPLLLIDPPKVRTRSHLKRWWMKLWRKKRQDRIARKARRLHVLQTTGRIDIDLDDPVLRQTAITVAMALHDAFTVYRPAPYEGCVHLLLSREGLKPSNWGKPGRLESCFAGELQIREVADSSAEVMDVKNPELAQHITEYLQRVRVQLRDTVARTS